MNPGGKTNLGGSLEGQKGDISNEVVGTADREGEKCKHWSSLFGVKLNGKSIFPLVHNFFDLVKGKFSMFVLDQIIDHNIALMEKVLVGKFMGPKPNVEVVREFFKNKWRINGKVTVPALPRGFFAIEFTCKEDILAVRSGGTWVIGKSSLTLKKWTSRLDLSNSIFENVPIWARLLGLLLEYYNEDVLNGIASSFGELLSIDPMTTARKRLVFARIYAGVSQNADLHSSIDIQSKLGTWTQTIEF